MLKEHSILAGSPRLNYLTLPVTLKKEDYQRFLAGIEDFAQVYRAELNTLAAATA